MDAFAQPELGLPQVCVVMHDVSPSTWGACEDLLGKLSESSTFATTLLLVPDYHHLGDSRCDDRFCHAMDVRRTLGDELALHGYYHLDDQALHGPASWIRRRIYTASEGEFSALPEPLARRRMEAGIAWFEQMRWPIDGFVAPAWLMGAGAWEAVGAVPFHYTTTLNEIILLPERIRIAAPCLTYSARSALRRQVSSIYLGARARTLRSSPIVRLGLHPIDARFPTVVEHWQRLVEDFSQTHRFVTKSAAVAAARLAIGSSARHARGDNSAQINHIDAMPTATPTTAPARTSLG